MDKNVTCRSCLTCGQTKIASSTFYSKLCPRSFYILGFYLNSFGSNTIKLCQTQCNWCLGTIKQKLCGTSTKSFNPFASEAKFAKPLSCEPRVIRWTSENVSNQRILLRNKRCKIAWCETLRPLLRQTHSVNDE